MRPQAFESCVWPGDRGAALSGATQPYSPIRIPRRLSQIVPLRVQFMLTWPSIKSGFRVSLRAVPFGLVAPVAASIWPLLMSVINRQQAADAPVGAHGMLLLCLALDIHVRALDGHRDAPLAVLVHELAAFDRAAGARLAAQLDVTDALQT